MAEEEDEERLVEPDAAHPHVGATREFVRDLAARQADLTRQSTLYDPDALGQLKEEERRSDISVPLLQAERVLGQSDKWRKHSSIRKAQIEGKHKGLISSLVPADSNSAPLIVDHDTSHLPVAKDTSKERIVLFSRAGPAESDHVGYEANVADRYLALLDLAGLVFAYVHVNRSIESGAVRRVQGGRLGDLRAELASFHPEGSQFVPAAPTADISLQLARLEGRQDVLGWSVPLQQLFAKQPLPEGNDGEQWIVVWAVPLSWTQDPYPLVSFRRQSYESDRLFTVPLDLVLRRAFDEARWRIRNRAQVDDQTILQHSSPLIHVASRLYETETADLLRGASTLAKAWVGRIGLQLCARRVLWLSSLGLPWQEAREAYLTKHVLPRVENDAAKQSLQEVPFTGQLRSAQSRERYRFAPADVYRLVRLLVLNMARGQLKDETAATSRTLVLRLVQGMARLAIFFPLATLQLLVTTQPAAEFGTLFESVKSRYEKNTPTLRQRFLWLSLKHARAIVSDPSTPTLWACLADHPLQGDAIGRADQGEVLPGLAPPYRSVARDEQEARHKQFLVHVLQADNYHFLPMLESPVARGDGCSDPLMQYTWWKRWKDLNQTKPPPEIMDNLMGADQLRSERAAYAAHHRIMGLASEAATLGRAGPVSRPRAPVVRIDVESSSSIEEEEEAVAGQRVPPRLSPQYSTAQRRRKELFLMDDSSATMAKTYPRLSVDPATSSVGFFDEDKRDELAVHGDRMRQLNSYVRFLWYQRRSGGGGEDVEAWPTFVKRVHELAGLADVYAPLSRLAIVMGERPFFRVAIDVVMGTTPFQWSRYNSTKNPDKEYPYKVSFSYLAGWLCNRPLVEATGLHEPLDYKNQELFKRVIKDGYAQQGSDAQHIGLFDARAADLLQPLSKLPFQVRYDATLKSVLEDDEKLGGGRGRMPLDYVTLYDLRLNSSKVSTSRKFKSELTFIPWRNPVKDVRHFLGPASGLARSNVSSESQTVILTSLDMPSVWIRVREIMTPGHLGQLSQVAMARDGQLAFASQHRLAQFELGRFYAHMFLEKIAGAGPGFVTGMFTWLSNWATEAEDEEEGEHGAAHLSQGVLHAFRSFLAYGYLPSTPLFDVAAILAPRSKVLPQALPQMLEALVHVAWIWGMGETSNTMQLLSSDALSLLVQWSRSPAHVRAFAQTALFESKTRGLRLVSPIVQEGEQSAEVRRQTLLERRGWHTVWPTARAPGDHEMRRLAQAVFDQHVQLAPDITAETVAVELEANGITLPTRSLLTRGMSRDAEERRVFHIPSLVLDTLRSVVLRDTNAEALQEIERTSLQVRDEQVERAKTCGWIGIDRPLPPRDPRPRKIPEAIRALALDATNGPEDLEEELSLRTPEEEEAWRRERLNRQKAESKRRQRAKNAAKAEMPKAQQGKIAEQLEGVIVEQEDRMLIDLAADDDQEEEEKKKKKKKQGKEATTPAAEVTLVTMAESSKEKKKERRRKRKAELEAKRAQPKLIDQIYAVQSEEEELAELVAPVEDAMEISEGEGGGGGSFGGDMPSPPPAAAEGEEEAIPRGIVPQEQPRAPAAPLPIPPSAPTPVPATLLETLIPVIHQAIMAKRIQEETKRMAQLQSSARARSRAAINAEFARLIAEAKQAQPGKQ
jgi:hypothetical protein